MAAYHPSIVCDWVEVYGPVVTAGHQPAAWPEVLVLDAVPFQLPDFYPNGAPKRAGLLVRRGLYTKKGSKSSDEREDRFTSLGLAAEWAAFNRDAWDRFTTEAARYADLEVLRWIARNGPTITTEFGTRPDYVPKSTGALKGHLA
ncbi:MAG TPA: hypothetical protein VMS99_18330 [Acidimicrobiia bacterium]|nr:hypothetical protein [Acidimicrobiia bacterium]